VTNAGDLSPALSLSPTDHSPFSLGRFFPLITFTTTQNALQQITHPQQGLTPQIAPPQWEFLHNHAFLLLRLCFRGHELDPNFSPPEVSPDNITLPLQRPVNQGPVYRTFAAGPAGAATSETAASDSAFMTTTSTTASGTDQSNRKAPPSSAQHGAASRQESTVSVPSAVSVSNSNSNSNNNGSSSTPLSFQASSTSDTDRLQSLVAVREQIDLLNRFRGFMPDEELANRKRALYQALPPAPPPTGELDDAYDDEDPPQDKKRRAT